MLSAGEMQRPRAQACCEIARATQAAASTTPVHSLLEAEAGIEQPPHAFDALSAASLYIKSPKVIKK